MFVQNPHSNYQEQYFFPRRISDEEFIKIIEKFEIITGLHLMARTEGELVQGFVTMLREEVGSTIFVCIYTEDQMPKDHVKVTITSELKNKLAKVTF